MNAPVIKELTDGSPAHISGLAIGDSVMSLNGQQPRDVIEWQRLVDESEISLEVERGGLTFSVDIEKRPGEPLGIEVEAALFDQVRTCDNHCDFCFIYQLPKGMRRTLYLKDDDYRLSFLYGNFTTLTRFTESDLERVISEHLSPLYVSIHATDPDLRSVMLRNRRGAVSLRWLEAILQAGIEVHGQVVCCPGMNDATSLDVTLAQIADRYSKLASVAVVPLGVSKFSPNDTMREHTKAEANAVIDIVTAWQQRFTEILGRSMVYCSDEYYLRAGRRFPELNAYDGVDMYEDGIGMAARFSKEFHGEITEAKGTTAGFFNWVEGAPAQGYRAPRTSENGHQTLSVSSCSPDAALNGSTTTTLVEDASKATSIPVRITPRVKKDRPIAIITSELGAEILKPLIQSTDFGVPVRTLAIKNDFFGGNVAVTGLIVGEDIAKALQNQPNNQRYLLPDVCLSNGRFLDGTTPQQLPIEVEVVPTDGISLRSALQQRIKQRA